MAGAILAGVVIALAIIWIFMSGNGPKPPPKGGRHKQWKD
jgi:hypothetical protein